MLPRIIGRMPYRSLPGFQLVPSRNCSGPILAMVGRPFANRNRQISATARIDTQAQTVKTHCIIVSLGLTDFVFIFLYLTSHHKTSQRHKKAPGPSRFTQRKRGETRAAAAVLQALRLPWFHPRSLTFLSCFVQLTAHPSWWFRRHRCCGPGRCSGRPRRCWPG